MAKLNQRLSPSGPVIGQFGFGDGFLVQAQTLNMVGGGDLPLNVPTEIASNMGVYIDFRPQIPQVSVDNRYQVELSFDIELLETWITGTITTEIQVSRNNGGSWTTVHSVSQEYDENNPTTPRVWPAHIEIKTEMIDVDSLAGFVDGESLTARGRIWAAGTALTNSARVISEAADGTCYCTISELLKVS